jgi:hypothetical protein
MTVTQIEQEFGEPIQDIIMDMVRPDYMDKCLDASNLAGALGIGTATITRVARKHGIKFPRGHQMPTHYEDLCWVKYGLTLWEYLKMRAPFLTHEEMAVDLETTKAIIRERCRRFGIRLTNLASTHFAWEK